MKKRLDGASILLLEDDDEHYMEIKNAMSDQGASVRWFSNAEEAKSFIERGGYDDIDFALLDLYLGDDAVIDNGRDFANFLYEWSPVNTIPCALFSGNTDRAEVIRDGAPSILYYMDKGNELQFEANFWDNCVQLFEQGAINRRCRIAAS